MCRILEIVGFVRIGQRGSHARYRHADGRTTVVPVHNDELLGIGLLREILGQAALSREEYLLLRRRV
jgi:predicted RNA binding protein YcfA (HicA-like mRNA interferase family)